MSRAVTSDQTVRGIMVSREFSGQFVTEAESAMATLRAAIETIPDRASREAFIMALANELRRVQ